MKARAPLYIDKLVFNSVKNPVDCINRSIDWFFCVLENSVSCIMKNNLLIYYLKNVFQNLFNLIY